MVQLTLRPVLVRIESCQSALFKIERPELANAQQKLASLVNVGELGQLDRSLLCRQLINHLVVGHYVSALVLHHVLTRVNCRLMVKLGDILVREAAYERSFATFGPEDVDGLLSVGLDLE